MKNETIENLKSHIIHNLTDFVVPEGSQQRTIGDLISYKIKNIIKDYNDQCIESSYSKEHKRSLDDFVIIEKSGKKNLFNTKTHNICSKFSMPNLSSVKKIKDVLENENNDIFYIFVDYYMNGSNVIIASVKIKNVIELNLNFLRVGSLGKGQLQMLDYEKCLYSELKDKQEWFMRFKNLVKNYQINAIKRLEKEILQWT
jgi:hypothetical protein